MTALSIEELDPGLEPEPAPTPEPPPADVYRLLQVLPTAPRDLIDEAYWVLGARAMHMPTAGGHSARYIAALNWAYETATRAWAVRVLHDEAGEPTPEPPQRAWPKFFRSRTPEERPSPKHLSYYDLLCVQPYADPKIIDLAATVILRTSGGFTAADAAMRDLIRVARRVLINPKTRAEHDLRLGLVRPEPEAAPVVEPDTPATARPQPTEPTSEGLDEHALPAALAATSAVDDGEPRAGAQVVELREHRPEMPAPVTTIERAEDAPQPTPSAPSRPTASSSNKAATADEASADAQSTTAAEDTMPPRHGNRMRAWFSERMARARGAHRNGDDAADEADSDEADDERLRSLQKDEGRASPWTRQQALANLRFIAGPRLGQSIRIGNAVLTLGEGGESDEPLADAATVGPRYGRIWQQGDHFIFRQLDDADVKIGGEQLLIPVVVLENGDQIAYGEHVLEFTQTNE